VGEARSPVLGKPLHSYTPSTEEEMNMEQDSSGKSSTTKHVPRPPRPTPPIRYFDASHPIYSNQIEVRFGSNS
jgi:hypothetical protein